MDSRYKSNKFCLLHGVFSVFLKFLRLRIPHNDTLPSWSVSNSSSKKISVMSGAEIRARKTQAQYPWKVDRNWLPICSMSTSPCSASHCHKPSFPGIFEGCLINPKKYWTKNDHCFLAPWKPAKIIFGYPFWRNFWGCNLCMITWDSNRIFSKAVFGIQHLSKVGKLLTVSWTLAVLFF